MEKGQIIISTDPTSELRPDPNLPDEVDPSDLDAAPERRDVVVDSYSHDARLDRTLAMVLPEFSRSYLQQLIANGSVTQNGILATKSSGKVKAGDKIGITLTPTEQSQSFRPEPIDLPILYEDEHLCVIDKPAGLVVHPAPGNWSGTILNGLLARYPGAAFLPRAGIVHRLDKDTSGLMVVAKDRKTMDGLVDLIADREVKRQYLAMAHRPWVGNAIRTIETAIGRDPKNRLRMATVDLDRQSGKAARTTFELIQQAEEGCLVLCSLHTGRTHQIRVHMSSIGHALVGDGLYGGAPAAGMARQALHASKLAFVHPISGEDINLHSPLPEDFSSALKAWGLRYNDF